jgi:hypothetical protein
VIAYVMVPLSLAALRHHDPKRTRPLRLPAASLVAPSAFVVASELLLFGGWKLIAAILIGYALLVISMFTDRKARAQPLDWRNATWLWPYLFGMAAISYLSSFDTRAPSAIRLIASTAPQHAHLRLGRLRRRAPESRCVRNRDPEPTSRRASARIRRRAVGGSRTRTVAHRLVRQSGLHASLSFPGSSGR